MNSSITGKLGKMLFQPIRVTIEPSDPIDALKRALDSDAFGPGPNANLPKEALDDRGTAARIHGLLHDLEDPKLAPQIIESFINEARIQPQLFTGDDRAELDKLIVTALEELLRSELERLAAAAHEAIVTVPDTRSDAPPLKLEDLDVASVELPTEIQRQFSNTKLSRGPGPWRSTADPKEVNRQWAIDVIDQFVRDINEPGVTRASGRGFHILAQRWSEADHDRMWAVGVALNFLQREAIDPMLGQAMREFVNSERGKSTDLTPFAPLFDFCESVTSIEVPETESFFDLNDPKMLLRYLDRELEAIEALPIGHEESVPRINNLLQAAAHQFRLSLYQTSDWFIDIAERAGRDDLSKLASDLADAALLAG